jgi:MFS family permease
VTRSLAPLRHRGFRRLAAGQFASSIGDACYAIALPWYVLATHGGALLLGTVLAAYGIPRTAALIFGGHASDRWRPWTVMMTSDAVRVVAVAAMAAAAAAGPARAAILIPIAVVLGAGEGFFLPGSYSIIPTLLPDADLQAGNALSAAGNQLAMLGGPALGGALVAILGPAPALALDAATFAISALTLAGVRAAQRRPASAAPASERPAALPRTPAAATAAEPAAEFPLTPAAASSADAAADLAPMAALAEPPKPSLTPPAATAAEPAAAAGPTLLSMLRSERILQIILLVTVAANLGSGGTGEVAMPALAHGPLHAGAGGYGGMVAAFAGGALLGTLAAGWLRGVRRPAIVGSAAFIAEAVFLAAAPYLGSILADGAALAAFGFLNGIGNIVMITLFQRWAPPELLGRLMGMVMLASFGIFPVSVILGAVVVHDLGPAPFFPLAAAVTAAAILAGLTQRTWRDLGATDEPAATTPAASATVPEVAAATTTAATTRTTGS